MESFLNPKKNGTGLQMTDKMSVENEATLQKENLELWKRIAILENENESLVQWPRQVSLWGLKISQCIEFRMYLLKLNYLKNWVISIRWINKMNEQEAREIINDFEYASDRFTINGQVKSYKDDYIKARNIIFDALVKPFKDVITESDIPTPADSTVCNIPPAGWHCTRSVGHSGPCAAIPLYEHELPIETKEVSEREFWEMCAKVMFASYMADQNKQSGPSNRAAMIVKALGYTVKQ